MVNININASCSASTQKDIGDSPKESTPCFSPQQQEISPPWWHESGRIFYSAAETILNYKLRSRLVDTITRLPLPSPIPDILSWGPTAFNSYSYIANALSKNKIECILDVFGDKQKFTDFIRDVWDNVPYSSIASTGSWVISSLASPEFSFLVKDALKKHMGSAADYIFDMEGSEKNDANFDIIMTTLATYLLFNYVANYVVNDIVGQPVTQWGKKLQGKINAILTGGLMSLDLVQRIVNRAPSEFPSRQLIPARLESRLFTDFFNTATQEEKSKIAKLRSGLEQQGKTIKLTDLIAFYQHQDVAGITLDRLQNPYQHGNLTPEDLPYIQKRLGFLQHQVNVLKARSGGASPQWLPGVGAEGGSSSLVKEEEQATWWTYLAGLSGFSLLVFFLTTLSMFCQKRTESRSEPENIPLQIKEEWLEADKRERNAREDIPEDNSLQKEKSLSRSVVTTIQRSSALLAGLYPAAVLIDLALKKGSVTEGFINKENKSSVQRSMRQYMTKIPDINQGKSKAVDRNVISNDGDEKVIIKDSMKRMMERWGVENDSEMEKIYSSFNQTIDLSPDASLNTSIEEFKTAIKIYLEWDVKVENVESYKRLVNVLYALTVAININELYSPGLAKLPGFYDIKPSDLVFYSFRNKMISYMDLYNKKIDKVSMVKLILSSKMLKVSFYLKDYLDKASKEYPEGIHEFFYNNIYFTPDIFVPENAIKSAALKQVDAELLDVYAYKLYSLEQIFEKRKEVIEEAAFSVGSQTIAQPFLMIFEREAELFRSQMVNATYNSTEKLLEKIDSDNISKDFISRFVINREYNVNYLSKENLTHPDEAIQRFNNVRSEVIIELYKTQKELIKNFTNKEKLNDDFNKARIFQSILEGINHDELKFRDFAAIYADNEIKGHISNILEHSPKNTLSMKYFEREFKALAVNKIFSWTNFEQETIDKDELVEFYDRILNDESGSVLVIANKLNLYVNATYRIAQDMLYRFNNGYVFHIDTSKLPDPEGFQKHIFQSYLLSHITWTPTFYEEYRYISRLPVNHHGISDITYYGIYNYYINSGYRCEAREIAIKFSSRIQPFLNAGNDVLEKTKSTEKYTFKFDTMALITPDGLSELKFSALYTLYKNTDFSFYFDVFNFENGKRYFYAYIDKIIFIEVDAEIDECLLAFRMNSSPRAIVDNFERLLKTVGISYKDIKKILEGNGITVSYTGKIFFSALSDAEQKRISEVKDKLHSVFTFSYSKNNENIYDVIRNEAGETLIKLAKAMKENNKYTPFLQYFWEMIPFAGVISRKINDPGYSPTVDDMKWDIADLGSTITLSLTKITYTGYKVINKIISKSAKELKLVDSSLSGRKLLNRAVKKSLPEIVKKYPGLQDSMQSLVLWLSDAFNPSASVVLFYKMSRAGYKFTINSLKNARAINLRHANQAIKNYDDISPGKPFGSDSKFNSWPWIEEPSPEEIASLEATLKTDLSRKDYNLKGTTIFDIQEEGNLIWHLDPLEYKPRIISIITYKSTMDKSPTKYYAVLINKNSRDFVVDIHFGKMNEASDTGYLIDSFEGWCMKMTSTDKLKNKMTIVKEYPDVTIARKDALSIDGSIWLDSDYLKDDSYIILNMPDRFVRQMDASLISDFHIMEGGGDLIMPEQSLSRVRAKLIGVLETEESYKLRNEEVPIKIINEKNMLENKLKILENDRNLQSRVAIYTRMQAVFSYHNEANSIIQLQTPLSEDLLEIFKNTDGVSYTSLAGIKLASPGERGVFCKGKEYFISIGDSLYKFHYYNEAAETATILVSGKRLNIEYSGRKWHYQSVRKEVYTETNIDRMVKGDPEVFRIIKGFTIREEKDISTEFEGYVESIKWGHRVQKHFDHATLLKDSEDIKGLSTTTGNNILAKARASRYFDMEGFDDTVEYIELNNLDKLVTIKIPLSKLPPGKKIIVSGQNLSGSMMIYSVNEDFFYAARIDESVYETPVSGFDFAYRMLNNYSEKDRASVKSLPVSLFPDAENVVVVYDGAVTKTPDLSKGNIKYMFNKNFFDYNSASENENSEGPRSASAFAILSKENGKVIINTHVLNYEKQPDNSLNIIKQKNILLKGADYYARENHVFETSVRRLSDIYSQYSFFRTISILKAGKFFKPVLASKKNVTSES